MVVHKDTCRVHFAVIAVTDTNHVLFLLLCLTVNVCMNVKLVVHLQDHAQTDRPGNVILDQHVGISLETQRYGILLICCHVAFKLLRNKQMFTR